MSRASLLNRARKLWRLSPWFWCMLRRWAESFLVKHPTKKKMTKAMLSSLKLWMLLWASCPNRFWVDFLNVRGKARHMRASHRPCDPWRFPNDLWNPLPHWKFWQVKPNISMGSSIPRSSEQKESRSAETIQARRMFSPYFTSHDLQLAPFPGVFPFDAPY